MFLDTSFKNILQELEDPIFFPATINYKSLYEKKNILMNYFFSVLDSPEIVQKKKAYFEKKISNVRRHTGQFVGTKFAF